MNTYNLSEIINKLETLNGTKQLGFKTNYDDTIYTVEKLKNDFILIQDVFGDVEYDPNMFNQTETQIEIGKFINDVMHS